MAVFNLGSVNADLFYRLPHMPAPGETLAALSHDRGLGGKGANMSVAVARAGARAVHIGAVGPDGVWMRERLEGYGVDVAHLALHEGPSGHAVIYLDPEGENSIVIFPGANRQIAETDMTAALDAAQSGDIAVFQNETNLQRAFAETARAKGLTVAYAAAPFEAAAVQEVLDLLDLLVMNRIEAEQLQAATGLAPEKLPVRQVVITLGAEGCRWIDTVSGESRDFPAPKVQVVDTTGAGDTFTGYLMAGLDRGEDMATAITLAQRAAALKVTRAGTADAIPTRDEVLAAG